MHPNLSRLNTSSWFSKDTKFLAYQLLFNLEIQQGTQLARILGVDPILYNCEAVYVWVQRQLDDGLTMDDYTLRTLETAFIDCVSMSSNHAA